MSRSAELRASDGCVAAQEDQVTRSLLLRDLCENENKPTVLVPFSQYTVQTWADCPKDFISDADTCSTLAMLGDFLRDANFVDACTRKLARQVELLQAGVDIPNLHACLPCTVVKPPLLPLQSRSTTCKSQQARLPCRACAMPTNGARVQQPCVCQALPSRLLLCRQVQCASSAWR